MSPLQSASQQLHDTPPTDILKSCAYVGGGGLGVYLLSGTKSVPFRQSKSIKSSTISKASIPQEMEFTAHVFLVTGTV